jgi:hypothetical protein
VLWDNFKSRSFRWLGTSTLRDTNDREVCFGVGAAVRPRQREMVIAHNIELWLAMMRRILGVVIACKHVTSIVHEDWTGAGSQSVYAH